ncbi:MAG: insulinase family protein [Acidobacteria bacterium]|nr:insulinase family protein [Acidobacteriota bacterium]
MSSTGAPARDITTSLLPNGLPVITECMPHVRSVSVGVWIGSGSRRETGSENGISHFLEHMLFKGTETRTAEDIARSVDSIGGNLDAFTTRELVSFNTKILDEHLPRAFEVLSDMVLNPAFREDDIEKEKGVILEELKMEVDNPEYQLHELFSSRFWGNHALGKPILGTRGTIRGFHQTMLRDYHRRVYVPGNLVITAAGHLKHDELYALAAEQFGGLRGDLRLAPETQPAPKPEIILKNKRLAQVHVCLGVPSVPMAHEGRFACYVLNTILGAGMSSRLFQNIREREGLAYSIFSELNLFRDAGWLAVYAGTSRESLPRVIELTLAEFRDLKENALPEEELRRAKDHLKGSLMLGLESSSSRMANLARQHMYFGRFFSLDEMLESIERVSADEVMEMACEFFQRDRIALTVLGKLDGLRIGREDLAC